MYLYLRKIRKLIWKWKQFKTCFSKINYLKYNILYIAFCFYGCNETEISFEDEAQIYGLFVDSLTMANPFEIKEEIVFTQEFKDSLNKISDTIMINPNKQEIKERESLILEKNDPYFLISMNKNKEVSFPKREIKSKEGHNIIYGTDLENYPGREPQILLFSPIGFNKDRNSAAVIVTYSRGRLSSFTNIYFLEKEKNEWFIITSEPLSRS